MGWWSYNIYTSPKEECDNCYTHTLEKNGVKGQDKVLCSCMKGNIYYAVIERTWEDDTPREVWAAVARIHYSPKAKYDNFAIKEIDETMGPYYYDMPEKYLDMLTEPYNDWAKEWRKKCREHIAKRKALQKYKIGTKIAFEAEYDMSDGIQKGDTITLTKIKRGRTQSYWSAGICE